MNLNEELKTLKVFSEKLGEVLEFRNTGETLVPAINASWGWLDNGWSNYSGHWVDNGWNNYSGSWIDNGWNNYSGSWSDGSWSNYGGGGGGCFITTAAVEFMGLDDDCEELNTLRIFRDKLVAEDSELRELVLEYYRTAPQIVKAISESEDKEEVLNEIYNDVVLTVVSLLKAGEIEQAKKQYLAIYNRLKERYYPTPQRQYSKGKKTAH